MSYLYACYIKYSSFGPQFIVDHCLAVCCRVQQPNRILSNVREKEKKREEYYLNLLNKHKVIGLFKVEGYKEKGKKKIKDPNTEKLGGNVNTALLVKNYDDTAGAGGKQSRRERGKVG